MEKKDLIKTLEYIKRNCGLPEYGNEGGPNRKTIAIDAAIETIEKYDRLV